MAHAHRKFGERRILAVRGKLVSEASESGKVWPCRLRVCDGRRHQHQASNARGSIRPRSCQHRAEIVDGDAELGGLGGEIDLDEQLEPAADRLKNFVSKLGQATLKGDVFDDAATGQGLLNFFLRGINCGAIKEEEALATGLTLDEIRGKSFVKIMQNRRKA